MTCGHCPRPALWVTSGTTPGFTYGPVCGPHLQTTLKQVPTKGSVTVKRAA